MSKHGSGLNQAEIEISLSVSCCCPGDFETAVLGETKIPAGTRNQACALCPDCRKNYWSNPRKFRIILARTDGTTQGYAAIRAKEGALAENNGSISFPPAGKRGGFVMEFQRDALQSTFSLLVNDQPLFSGLNLRKMTFLSF